MWAAPEHWEPVLLFIVGSQFSAPHNDLIGPLSPVGVFEVHILMLQSALMKQKLIATGQPNITTVAGWVDNLKQDLAASGDHYKS